MTTRISTADADLPHSADCDEPELDTCHTFECDVCTRPVPSCTIGRVIAYGIETYACEECRS